MRTGVPQVLYPEPTTLKYRSEVGRSGAGPDAVARATSPSSHSPISPDSPGRDSRDASVLFKDQIGGRRAVDRGAERREHVGYAGATIESRRWTGPVRSGCTCAVGGSPRRRRIEAGEMDPPLIVCSAKI